jgi:uncharacterized membrane protein HdeD (DUF308 family)
MARKTQKKPDKEPLGLRFPWCRANYLLLLLGVVAIILGFIFLSIGPVNSFWSMNMAPVLLVLGYCVIVPVAILYRKREKEPQQ